MNLRKAENYRIGLDIGTASVGWAVVDENGEPYSFKGKTTWGSRLFAPAETAAKTRAHRSLRRRYDRRRQRLNLLQELFAEEMSQVDSEFFIRMKQSRLLPKDRSPKYQQDYLFPLFNDCSFSEREYYEKFPTIYHLRSYLAKSEEKADIRLIYLALHHIIKYRGNFLRQGELLTAKDSSTKDAVAELINSLEEYYELHDYSANFNGADIVTVLEDSALRAAEKAEQLAKLLHSGSDKEGKDFARLIARALVGYKVEFSNMLDGVEKDADTSFRLSEDKADSFHEKCGDDRSFALFEAIQSLYRAYVLSTILAVCSDGTLSDAMMRRYDNHKKDLRVLKRLINRYCPEKYDYFFRGEKDSFGNYKLENAKGYTAYVTGRNKITHEQLLNEVMKLFKDIDEINDDKEYLAIKHRLNKQDGNFLQKIRIRDNGAIPYQLHLEELQAIIQRQGKHYPFLLDDYRGQIKIESLLTFRIPYYVGPLNSQNNPEGARQFAWSVRYPEKKGISIRPWNFEEIIDKDKSAEEFIRRMTGTCTYLFGQDVLPRHSLLYEEFTVLNELNGVRWNKDGENFHRFDVADRLDLVRDLFQKRKKVSVKAVQSWLLKRGFSNNTVKGTQGETAFESKLESYNDFCRILGVERIDGDDYEMVENIILWVTLFEDKSILVSRVKSIYGHRLDDKQIIDIEKLRYSGWGRLSKDLLCNLKAETDNGPMSLMDILREGNPNEIPIGSAMTMQEILTDRKFEFPELIEQFNIEHSKNEAIDLADLPGSPAVKRSISQATKIVEEIIGIAGRPPERICVEVTRSDDLRNRGKRTTRRYQRLKIALEKLVEENPSFYREVLKQLSGREKDVAKNRFMLYFAQGGKCLYSRKALKIDELSSYEVDHIIPQSYIKDDSLDNLALVLKGENQHKGDSLLLDRAIVGKQFDWWQQLRGAGLMSDKKFNNLTRREISDRSVDRFINRQLVETSQAIKLFQQEIRKRLPDVEVVPIKAELTSGIREAYGFVKCRDINDYHHAHDAYLACQMDRFIELRYPKWNDGRYLGMMRRFVKQKSREQSVGKSLLGSRPFIVDSFGYDGFDRDTGEIFQDAWNAQEQLSMMRKHLNRKDCFISRRTTVEAGAFWDETIYSPKANKRRIPLKVNLCTEKYGGYSGEQYAYFVVFRAMDMKGRMKFFFEGVPRNIAAKVCRDEDVLQVWAESIAQDKNCHDVLILDRKILRGVKFVHDGSELLISGGTEAGISRQPAYSQRDGVLIQQIVDSARLGSAMDVSDSELVAVYNLLSLTLDKICPRLAEVLNLNERRETFKAIGIEEKIKVISAINARITGKRGRADLSLIGGSKNSGGMHASYHNFISDIELIDVSVTGMFERRYRVEL